MVGLSGYAFDIVFRDSAGNATAYFFTRFAIQPQADDDLDSDEHFVCATMTDGLPVKSAAEIASEGTKKDSMLVKVYKINILSLAGRVVVRGPLEMTFLWKMDVCYGVDVSSYHSHSNNACWKSYTSVIQGCAV